MTDAPSPSERAAPSARPALSEDVDSAPKRAVQTPSVLQRIRSATRTSVASGWRTGVGGSDYQSPTSKTSDAPSKNSTPHFKEPKSVREFAAQTRTVATMVLNGEMDVDRARAFSSLARTVAQTISAEVTKSRFLSSAPDLTFEDTEYDEP